jgi:hypothetical protein
MNTLINLLKDHQVGKWCKLAAWVVAAIGLVNIVLQVYASVQQYKAFGQFGQNLPSYVLPTIIHLALSAVPAYIFYFFVLYAVGVAINHFVGSTENDITDEDELEEEEESDLALDEEDSKPILVPGQME